MPVWKEFELKPGLSLGLAAEEETLLRVWFGGAPREAQRGRLPILDWAESELRAYWGGELERFTVPFELRGTEFQRRVWDELTRIPYGQTISYSELARRIGKPEAVRAVGTANGANPIPIIVPCHRVIGSNGSLTGFGGGLELKRDLLVREGVLLPL